LSNNGDYFAKDKVTERGGLASLENKKGVFKDHPGGGQRGKGEGGGGMWKDSMEGKGQRNQWAWILGANREKSKAINPWN